MHRKTNEGYVLECLRLAKYLFDKNRIQKLYFYWGNAQAYYSNE